MTPSKPLQEFRKTLRRSLFLTERESQLFDKIPDVVLDGIFRHNFNGNLATAERILFNRYRDVDDKDGARIDREKKHIHNMDRGGKAVARALRNGTPVLFVTDNDNDGSLAQAVLLEFEKAVGSDLRDLIHVEYAQPIGDARGITLAVVDLATEGRQWPTDLPMLIVTADNGINSREQVRQIQERYPRAAVIITDHHLPDPDQVVLEDERTLIVNPQYKPTDYFKRKNISGADTLGVMLTNAVLTLAGSEKDLDATQRTALNNMNEIGSWANLLDYAHADISDMPTRPYVVEKALELRPLLNVATSMSNFITGRYSKEELEQVFQACPQIDEVFVRGKIEDVETLNVMAHKLLNFYHRFKRQVHTFGEKEFYQELASELTSPYDHYESVNPNYIEQLRPVIFNLAAIDNKDLFFALLGETMTQVFEQLRQTERDLLEHLRTTQLLRQDKRANSCILYPIDKSLTKLFNRRLLGKAYNQENNGFLLTLSSFSGREVKGSMRSLYPIQDILEGKEAIEQELGVELEFQGHSMAAGFFIRSTTDRDLSEATLSRINAWIDDRLTSIKVQERINQIPNLEVDFASTGLVTKLNRAVKANLAGMWGLPTVIRFEANKDNQVFVTDAKTTEQISLREVVERKKFGYQAITTDFDGGAFVVPVELLRTIVESNFTKGLRLDYMDEGVFMASQVVDVDALPNVVKLKGGRRDQEALVEYFENTYEKSNFIELNREYFRNLPYFRFNKYGQGEFENWESLIIRLLDETQRDVLAVIDTEGTGLGKAPKCFNLGGTNISVDPDSGKALDKTEFESRYFVTEGGKHFLLTPEQRASLVALEPDEDPSQIEGQATILYNTTLSEGVMYEERYAYPGPATELERVLNVRDVEGAENQVIYNRQIRGFAFSFLVNNNDFAITKEFEDLTGIGNWMVERLGISAAAMDRQVTHYYESLKNAKGEPAKIIFQAHNMPYDKGVIAANFQKLNELIKQHVTSDTAKIARQAKLAYDDVPVSSFDNIEGIPAKVYFYDSPYSDYSLSTFLARCAQGKGGVFPDTKAKILLMYRPETGLFSIVDRNANREIELSCDLESLAKAKQVGQLPNNAVGFSVERLSARAMIRNIILLDKPKPERIELQANEVPFRGALEAFQDNYHFDLLPEVNIGHFRDSMRHSEHAAEMMASVDLASVAERFLAKNKALQARFHDGWIFEKVLSHYEPDAKTKRVPAEIVEQVNYHTDLPNRKIRQVFDAVIQFKRHFGIEHALVHEQHNNIRQTSEDGQGLADTAYECVLPQQMAIEKFLNPYYKSIEPTVSELIHANIKGSMVQHMLGDEFNNELARDSYSVAQMLAYRRQGKTDVVKQAQRMALGKDGQADGKPAVIRFNLPTEILLPGSAIYATPKRTLSQEEVREASEQLEFILVNEQIKSSVRLAKSMNREYAQTLDSMARANNAKCIALRDKLMEKFEKIEFSRQDAMVKKLSDTMRDLFAGKGAKVPKQLDAAMVDTLERLHTAFSELFDRLALKDDREQLGRMLAEDFMDQVRKRWALLQQAEAEAREEAAMAAADDGETEASEALSQKPQFVEATDEEPLWSDDPAEQLSVSTPDFLPELDIGRREPMRFALKHYGLEIFLPAVRRTMRHAATLAAEDVQATAEDVGKPQGPKP